MSRKSKIEAAEKVKIIERYLRRRSTESQPSRTPEEALRDIILSFIISLPKLSVPIFIK
ncbi:hypothetical protein [Mahella australiensis]|uniref:hypothetical protein n=1 Tax=Mahella australiensis TaxID=252966 RepID=UPI001494D5DC|nr:hypothetical protein [Mahella australiensis]